MLKSLQKIRDESAQYVQVDVLKEYISHCCHLLRWFRKYQYLANHAWHVIRGPVIYYPYLIGCE